MKTLFLILTLLISACTPMAEKSTADPMAKLRQDALSKIDVAACLDKGGKIQNVCRLGMPFCITNYMDAGKACSDSSECAGECKIEGEFVETGTKTSGFCSVDNDPCGCFQLIVKGKAEHALCAD